MKIICKHLYKLFGLSLLSLFLLLGTSHSTLAVGKPSDLDATGQGRMKERPHLKDAKLRACQAKENAIKTRTAHLVNLVTGMETKFDAIAFRVEEYYTTRVVPSGKTVANYDALVADIQAKKTVLQTAVAAVQGNSEFDCTSDNPKEKMTQFRTNMLDVKTALKEYRTTIKNLIVAVH